TQLTANCPVVRVYRRTWTATDDCTNRASCSQTIAFIDTTPPILVCPSNITVNCFFGIPPCPGSLGAFQQAGGSASDTCDTNLTYLCSDGPFVGNGCGGTIRRTHTVIDDCTNSASCVQIITLFSSEGPGITCAPDKQVQCGSGWTFDFPTANGL